MQKFSLFLIAGLAWYAMLIVIFPQGTGRAAYARHGVLLGIVSITAVSTSFFYPISHYLLPFDWMAIGMGIAFEALISFFVYGMVFGLDYHAMTEAIKHRLSRKP